MRPLAFIFVAAILTACYGPTNVSHYEPYSDFINQPLTLKRHAFLHREGFVTYLSDGDEDVVGTRYKVGWQNFNKMSPSEQESVVASYRQAHKIVELPPGTTMWLRKIRRYTHFEAGWCVEAFGDISISTDTKPVRFQYTWGFGKLDRAPWEENTVPLNRSAEHLGRKKTTKP